MSSTARFGIFDSFNGALQNFFAGAVEFVLDVHIRRADTGMDTRMFGIFQASIAAVDIAFVGAGKCANGWLFYCF